MTTITVEASRTYEVRIGQHLLADAGTMIREAAGGKKACLVTDDTVESLYGDVVKKSLTEAGYQIYPFVIPHGEASKCAKNYIALQEFMAENRITRTDILVALGGGVVGDLTGFAAATYLRGIPFVQIPTTVLAAVDSSVGGKTAIDIPQGKNLVGAFYQPWLVVCDTETFRTLPQATFEEGCAEMIKYGMINDAELLTKMDCDIKENMEELVAICVKHKRDIVQEDEFDTGKRQLLNLGHTIGHAIEMVSNFEITHGNAVGAGMAMVTRAAVRKGWCPITALQTVLKLNERYHLLTGTTYQASELYDIMTTDKKREGDTINLIVPTKLGYSERKKIPVTGLQEILELGCGETRTLTKGNYAGEVEVIPSKSVAHRLLIAAALSGVSICCDTFSKDIAATKQCLKAFSEKENDWYCGESGSTLRFLLPVAGALGLTGQFCMEGRLADRPMDDLYRELTAHGMEISAPGSNPMTVSGQLTSGEYVLPGDVSSQYITGLLFALPMLPGDSSIRLTTALQSKPYVALTLSVLRDAGICIQEQEDGYRIPGGQKYQLPANVKIEGDWSNGAFFLTLSAITDGMVTCTNLRADSEQGDRAVTKMLAVIKTPVADGTIRELCVRDVPDLVPILALAAAVTPGVTKFTEAERLRIKESDRLLSVTATLNRLGGQVEIVEEGEHTSLVVTGVDGLTGGMVDSFFDHRIAMMAAVASAVSKEPVIITDAAAVNKSYPGFFEILAGLKKGEA